MDDKLDYIAFALFEHSCVRDSVPQAKEYLSLWQLLPEGARQRWRDNASVAINAVNSYKQSVGNEGNGVPRAEAATVSNSRIPETDHEGKPLTYWGGLSTQHTVILPARIHESVDPSGECNLCDAGFKYHSHPQCPTKNPEAHVSYKTGYSILGDGEKVPLSDDARKQYKDALTKSMEKLSQHPGIFGKECLPSNLNTGLNPVSMALNNLGIQTQNTEKIPDDHVLRTSMDENGGLVQKLVCLIDNCPDHTTKTTKAESRSIPE